MVDNVAFSHRIDFVPIFLENLNLEEHLNCFIGSKVTAILVNGAIYLGVELHREGSALQHCAVGLFYRSKRASWSEIKKPFHPTGA